jgi:hypothetical protein
MHSINSFGQLFFCKVSIFSDSIALISGFAKFSSASSYFKKLSGDSVLAFVIYSS